VDYFAFLDHEGKESGRLSATDLDRRAREIAGTLQSLDLAGERALLVFPPGLECVVGLYGCLYAGVVAVPSPPPDPGREYALPRILEIVRDSRPRAVVTTTEIAEVLRGLLADSGEDQEMRFVAVDGDEVVGDDEWRDPGVGPDDLAMLQYTSGSTRVPRGVMITHANLVHNCQWADRVGGYSSEDLGVMWLPPYHDLGLIGGLFQPVFSSTPDRVRGDGDDRPSIVVMSPIGFLIDPLSWLRAISRYRATSSGGPDFAFERCLRRSTPEEREALDLSSWRFAYDGSELVRAEVMDAFSEGFAVSGFRREAFFPCYGLAEATLMVSCPEVLAGPSTVDADRSELESGHYVAAEPGPGTRTIVSCGRPLSDSRLVVVDPESHEPLADGRVGEIWVSGPSVSPGYWARESETAKTFGAMLADADADRFLRTGDLGFLLDGELYVTGRITEVIIVSGRTYYPTDIERVCEEAVPGLRRGCGAAFTVETDGRDRLAIVAEVKAEADHAAVIAGMRHAVERELGIGLAIAALIEPRAIPRTTSGKIQRGRCRGLLLNGELPVLAEWRVGG
jgi:acyl-CoA synthetase (AMP-forming)/AMP-acid ligase II